MKERRIRVVFGLNDFLVGGMQKQFSEQIRHFDRDRFDITLVTLFTFEDKETLYHALPGHLPVYKLAFKGWWDLQNWIILYRLLQKLRPDTVVSSLFFANTIFRTLKPFFGYVSLAREHNTYIHKPKLHQVIDRMLAPLSYRVVAVSTTVRDFTAKQEGIPLEKFVVIHNGIDAGQVSHRLAELPDKNMLRAQYNLSPQDLVFVNVARLTPQKNHELLIAGFAAFSKKHPACKLIVVGSGALKATLDARARAAGAVEHIRFIGHQTDPWPFYKMVDVFVSTSTIEGLSNAYLEALAAGLPLVATKTAGTDEIVKEGKNGFFIQDSTVESVVKSLEKVRDSHMEELKQGARESVKNFDLQTTVKKYEKLFSEAIN